MPDEDGNVTAIELDRAAMMRLLGDLRYELDLVRSALSVLAIAISILATAVVVLGAVVLI